MTDEPSADTIEDPSFFFFTDYSSLISSPEQCIKKAREEIDRTDAWIVFYLAYRLECARAIQRAKFESGKSATSEKREEEIFRNIAIETHRYLSSKTITESICSIYDRIFEESKRLRPGTS